MLNIEGTTLTDEDTDLISSPLVGALIFFARNYQNREQLLALVSQIRKVRPDLILAVDQEGGRVQRFRDEFEPLPSLQKIGDLARSLADELEEICFSFGWLMAADILSVGIDLSFAPVMDLDRNSCPAISDRSFSEDPKEASRMCRAYIRGMNEAGMAATAKHFPGHGKVTADSHKELPVDLRSMDELRSQDLLPFLELSSEYQAIMPGHLKFPQVDAQSVGFSSYWLQNVLRREMQFNGVIFSDDLTMEGAAASGSYAERAKLALDAGCDMLLVCNNREGAKEVLSFLQQRFAQETDAHALEQRVESAKRLEAMKAQKTISRDSFLRSKTYNRAHHYLQLIRSQG